MIATIFVVSAQDLEDKIPTKWKVKGVELNFSWHLQRISDMAYDDIYVLVRDKQGFIMDMTNYKLSEFASPEFEVDRLKSFVSLFKNTNHPYWVHEWQFGLGIDLYSEIYIEYDNVLGAGNQSYDYLGWCLLNNRFTFQANRLIRYNRDRFSLFTGVGLSLSTSFNDRVLIFDDEVGIAIAETEARSSQFLTGNFLVGGAIRVYKNVSLTLSYEHGLGWYSRGFSGTKPINESLALAGGVRYHLK